MNESLRRALLQAGLSEDDVAARLQVDPKTVRRWVEGRVPYLRHRWALAGMLGVDEADLWPQLRAAGSVPGEVQAIYPHLDAVPYEVWLRMFGSAEHRIDILAGNSDAVLSDPRTGAALAERARAGVPVRVCLVGPELAGVTGVQKDGGAHAVAGQGPPALAEALRAGGRLQVRLRSGILYAAVYRADDEVLVSQRAYGVPATHAPVLHLHACAGSLLAATHLETFERTWSGNP